MITAAIKYSFPTPQLLQLWKRATGNIHPPWNSTNVVQTTIEEKS